MDERRKSADLELDEIGILRNPKFMKTLTMDGISLNAWFILEYLQLSMPIIKVNQYNKKNERQLVITSRRILLLEKYS